MATIFGPFPANFRFSGALLVNSNYLEVLVRKYDAYKSKCILNTILIQNMVQLNWKIKTVHMD